MSLVTVRLFARLREELDCDRIEFRFDDSDLTVEQLIARLASDRGQQWDQALRDDNLVVAINQRVSGRGGALTDGDELALFPPVTGG